MRTRAIVIMVANSDMPTNALDYITIRGFKSIASIEKLALRPINVVIGPNGSGKSNFLEVFEFLYEIYEGKTADRLRDYVTAAGGAEKILHFGSKTTSEIVLDFAFRQERYELRFRPTADDGLYPSAGRSANVRDLPWRVYHFEDTSFSSPMRT